VNLPKSAAHGLLRNCRSKALDPNLRLRGVGATGDVRLTAATLSWRVDGRFTSEGSIAGTMSTYDAEAKGTDIAIPRIALRSLAGYGLVTAFSRCRVRASPGSRSHAEGCMSRNQ
jgi:hypothetical protein